MYVKVEQVSILLVLTLFVLGVTFLVLVRCKVAWGSTKYVRGLFLMYYRMFRHYFIIGRFGAVVNPRAPDTMQF